MTIESKPPVDAEIISLDAFREGAEPQLRVIKSPTCWCSLVFNEKERSVTCSRCGKVYDLFDAMVYLVKHWDRYAQNRNALKGKCEALQAKRDALRTEIKNLKAQAKRTKEKA